MPARRYDVEMIRDFLDHLLLEVRVAHSESTPHATQLNIEQINERKAYADRYDVNLLPRTRFDGTGVGKDLYESACETLREQFEQKYTRWLRSFEELAELFDDALACAARGGVTDRVIDVAQVAGNVSDD